MSGLKSGNSSLTSTFAYLEGNIAANGVSNLFGLSEDDLCDLRTKYFVIITAHQLVVIYIILSIVNCYKPFNYFYKSFNGI